MQTYERIPLIRLWKVLLVPLQGDITDTLAERLTEDVLVRVAQEDVSGLVIDVTGLWVMDSHLCAVLSKLAGAAALMGTRTLVSGLKPDIAMTLETMGVELTDVRTCRSLDEALERLGVRFDEAATL